MLDNALISIIVPVYKVEYWLPKCIKSILAQTYTNLEIILVDDGSPDKSGKICDAFAKKDGRIKVIHKENGGVSSARNAGIDAANGKYLCFVDADDWLPKDSIEIMYAEFDKYEIQITIGNLLVLGKYNKISKNVNKGRLLHFDSNEWLFESLYQETSLGGVVGKLLSAEIIKNHSIRFSQGMKLGEDCLFLLECFRHCQIISLIEAPVYCYNRLVAESAIMRHYPELTDWMLILAAARQALADQKGKEYKNREHYISKTSLLDFEYIINSTCIQKIEEDNAAKIFEKAYNAFKPYFYPDCLIEETVEYNIYYEIVNKYCKNGDFVGLYKKTSEKYSVSSRPIRRKMKQLAVEVYIILKRFVYRYLY